MTPDLTRRRFLIGAIAAPVVIRTAGILMPVKALPEFETFTLAPGTFRARYSTNNPAVIFLEIISDPRFAHGRELDMSSVTAMADYCEQQVSA